MTVVAVILLPVVLACQSWTYYEFRKRVSSNDYQQSATPAPAAAGAVGAVAAPTERPATSQDQIRPTGRS